MHLIYVIDSLVASGGAEQALAQMAPRWVAAGYEVDVVALSDKPGLQPTLAAGGVKVIELPLRRAAAVRGLVGLLRTRKPDLVHTTLFEADLAGRVAAVMAGVPVVTSLVNASYGPEHRQDPRLDSRRVRAAQVLDAVSARPGRRFHAITHHVADVMRGRLRLGSTPVDVIPRGRDPKLLGQRTPDRRDRVRAGLGVPLDVPVVLAAARQEHQKGLDVLLSALQQMGPEVRVVFAGRDGAATSELRAQAGHMGLGDRVLWLGTRADVPDLIAAADVVAVPSRWEGLGSVVIEAMGIGTPLVVSDVPAVRETLGGEDFGQLVPPGDPAALALGLIRGLDDGASRAEAARARFLDRFTLQAVCDEMAQFHARSLTP